MIDPVVTLFDFINAGGVLGILVLIIVAFGTGKVIPKTLVDKMIQNQQNTFKVVILALLEECQQQELIEKLKNQHPEIYEMLTK